MGLRKRFSDFRYWCPQPPNSFASKLKRYSAPPKYVDKQVKNRWGYAPITAGFALIALGVIALIIQLVVNSDLFNGVSYLDRFNFWFYWAPIIFFSLITGALIVVIGVAVLRKITNVFSYVSIVCGFALIVISTQNLMSNLAQSINIIGWSNFWGNWAIFFLPVLIIGGFLVVLGVVLGLRIRGRWGYGSIAGGLTSVLFGAATYIIKSESGSFYAGWQWDNFWGTLSPLFLIGGAFLVLAGMAYLLRIRSRNRLSEFQQRKDAVQHGFA